jgi:hypothetical protein
MEEPQATLANLESFFRIHFVRNEEILDDLLPQLEKIDPSLPLPRGMKSILHDSGPAVVLFNSVLLNPSNHYRPTSDAICTRAAELSDLVCILSFARKALPDKLYFNSLVAAFLHFHLKEIGYPQLFNFLLSVLNDGQLTRRVLALSEAKCLHFSVPYKPARGESEDDSFFAEDSDAAVRVVKKQVPRTPIEIVRFVSKVAGLKGDMALSLFLGGVISRKVLTILVPETEDLPLEYDPVGESRLGPCPSDECDAEQGPHRSPSYVVAPNAPLPKCTGASASDELVLNHRFSCVGTSAGRERTNVNAEMSLGGVSTGEDYLHELEYEANITVASILELEQGRTHWALHSKLTEIYGVLTEEIYDLVKAATTPPVPVISALRNALVAHTSNLYHRLPAAYASISECGVRLFPSPHLISWVLSELGFFWPDCDPVRLRVTELLVNWPRRINRPFPMSFADLVRITRFSVFYRRYLRLNQPRAFVCGPKCLADGCQDWVAVYEAAIQHATNECGLGKVDGPVRRDITKYLRSVEHAVQRMRDGIAPWENVVAPARLVAFTRQQTNSLSLEIVALDANPEARAKIV